MAKVIALIPCAGQGRRMGGSVNKAYLKIHDRPILAYTLSKFQEHPLIDGIVLVVGGDAVDYCRQEIILKFGFNKVQAVVAGGQERQDSVWQGLCHINEDTEWVVVHDGVRPLITLETITKALQTAFEKGTAVVGVPVKDTIKVVNPDLTVRDTPPRHSLWQVQTPQIFRREQLVLAYRTAAYEGWQGTDDASLVERLGEGIQMIRGEYSNIKVTTPEDFEFLKAMIKVEK